MCTVAACVLRTVICELAYYEPCPVLRALYVY
jgi:hypothetical protein